MLLTRIGAGIIVLGFVIGMIEANLYPDGEWGMVFAPFLIFGTLIGAWGIVRTRNAKKPSPTDSNSNPQP